jgi:hypothetical protein
MFTSSVSYLTDAPTEFGKHGVILAFQGARHRFTGERDTVPQFRPVAKERWIVQR